jgi:membrane-associated phospholipid phosphatase
MPSGDMTVRAFPLLPLLGLLLFGAGIALWQAPALDYALHRALLLPGDSEAVRWMLRFTMLGSAWAMLSWGLIAAAVLAWRGRRRAALWLLVPVLSHPLLVEAIKQVVRRPRPPVADRLEAISSWSFPSSHSAGTMMTAAALALLAGGRWPAWMLAVVVAGMIGWSRLALGVHWPSDVLAGWGLGLAWAGLTWRYGGPIRSG